MTEVATKCCSVCGGPLQDVLYGDCGPHVPSDFEHVEAYVIDAVDLFGDWGDPDYFVLPADRLRSTWPVWKAKDDCCFHKHEPMWDESDYCQKCGDVMEPASTDADGDDA